MRSMKSTDALTEGDGAADRREFIKTAAGVSAASALPSTLPAFSSRSPSKGVRLAVVGGGFGAKFWCQAESRHYSDPPADELLQYGVSLPMPGVELFLFELTRRPECALLVKRDGGILITCDSLQHWGDRRYCSILVRLLLPFIGFRHRTLIGPLWLKYMSPRDANLQADFERLLQLPFTHLVNAHGSLLREQAHSAASAAVHRAFS